MPSAIFGAIESGVIYAIMALGVYLSFRILDFPDLTVDGSFVTGAAVSAVLIVNGVNPFFATIIALLVGFIAGCITGVLHTVGKINALLAGILMMIALYSINLRIMGRANIPLLNTDTMITSIENLWAKTNLDPILNQIFSVVGLLPTTWGTLFFMTITVFIIKILIDWFLKTEIGLALRATGDNQRMIRSFSTNTNFMIIFGIGLSNALVAFSGAIIAQYGGFADIGMGIGMIIIGLASVIIGEALFGTKTIVRTTLAVIGGAIIYRIIVSIALQVEFLETGDMKLITAVIVIFALIMPKIIETQREKKRKRQKLLNSNIQAENPSTNRKEDSANASLKTGS